MPFHGIVSRGLLQLRGEDPGFAELWRKFAHRIDTPSPEDEAELIALRDWARSCCVLTFAQSASCAREHVANYWRSKRLGDGAACELWNIKEGHTSSVWHVAIHGSEDVPAQTFVVNIARDAAASRELEETASRMQLIAQKLPGINMARPLEVARTYSINDSGICEIVSTRNEWIPDAHEIHLLHDGVTNMRRYALVERFITRKDVPSCIKSIHGRYFTDGECHKIENDLERFMEQASQHVNVQVDINDGDLVWNGREAVVVAIR